jgi:hypothetical protein
MSVYAFDGTWNEAKDGDDPDYTNTNVFRFHEAYTRHSKRPDLDFYVPGVGTRFKAIGRALGGVFGLGELSRINEAYDALCTAWDQGERDIDIVGFSRGAATTLDFCHCIQERGIRKPGSDQVVEPSPKIRFLGVWDVVASFGLANLGNTALNIGHHLSLPKSNLRYCFHALALDERRPSFLPIRIEGACEVWFRGAHSDIGGGNKNRGLNDVTLRWMMRKAMGAQLPILQEDIDALKPDPAAPPSPAGGHKLPLGLVDRSSSLHGDAAERMGEPTRHVRHRGRARRVCRCGDWQQRHRGLAARGAPTRAGDVGGRAANRRARGYAPRRFQGSAVDAVSGSRAARQE